MSLRFLKRYQVQYSAKEGKAMPTNATVQNASAAVHKTSRAQTLREKAMRLERELLGAQFKKLCFCAQDGKTDRPARDRSMLGLLKAIAADAVGDIFCLRIPFSKEGESAFSVFFPPHSAAGEPCKGDILLVSHELSRTGAPVVIADAARELKRQGYFVIMASPKDGPLRQSLLEQGIAVIVDEELLQGLWSPVDPAVQTDWILDRLIVGFDLSIFCTAVLHNAISRYNHTGIPIVWWMHEGHESLRPLSGFMPRELGNNIKVFCGGRYVQDKLATYGLFYPSELFNYGVTDCAPQQPASQRDAAGRRIVFAVVGALCRRKGQDLLIEAIKRLSVRYLERSEFLFVGGPHEKETVALVQDFCKYWPNARLITEISHDALFALYGQIDCIVAPSRDDPLPVVLAEGMMLSKICLCSDNVGTSFYLKDGQSGFVFENENVGQLSEKLMEIVDRFDALAPMRAKSRKIYETVFSNDIFSESLLRIVRQTMPCDKL
jgi:Glycosyltransferase